MRRLFRFIANCGCCAFEAFDCMASKGTVREQHVSEKQKYCCAACEKELNLEDKGSFKTCMDRGLHRYVCDSNCMRDFYNPKPKDAVEKQNGEYSDAFMGEYKSKSAIADLAQIQAMVRIRNAAHAAHSAWLAHNSDRLAPDLSNHYTARQGSTDFAHAMLRLGAALEPT